MTIFSKSADVLRLTGATSSQLDYWLGLGLVIPHKEATSSGDHRLFSTLNVIEVALLVWLSILGLGTQRMKAMIALQRQTLAQVPPESRAVQAWLQYVRMVGIGAKLIGLTDDPAFKQWERDAALVTRRCKKQPTAPDARLLGLLAAQKVGVTADQKAVRLGAGLG